MAAEVVVAPLKVLYQYIHFIELHRSLDRMSGTSAKIQIR